MFRDLRGDPTFSPKYTFVAPNGTETPAPFPVVVFGTDSNKPCLGVGNIVGAVVTVFGREPVIEVTDVGDEQTYTLSGVESHWAQVTEHVVDVLAEGRVAITSVRSYLHSL